ncbi:hypothetical protein V8D89_016292 [Ganoderma adspersum]
MLARRPPRNLNTLVSFFIFWLLRSAHDCFDSQGMCRHTPNSCIARSSAAQEVSAAFTMSRSDARTLRLGLEARPSATIALRRICNLRLAHFIVHGQVDRRGGPCGWDQAEYDLGVLGRMFVPLHPFTATQRRWRDVGSDRRSAALEFRVDVRRLRKVAGCGDARAAHASPIGLPAFILFWRGLAGELYPTPTALGPPLIRRSPLEGEGVGENLEKEMEKRHGGMVGRRERSSKLEKRRRLGEVLACNEWEGARTRARPGPRGRVIIGMRFGASELEECGRILIVLSHDCLPVRIERSAKRAPRKIFEGSGGEGGKENCPVFWEGEDRSRLGWIDANMTGYVCRRTPGHAWYYLRYPLFRELDFSGPHMCMCHMWFLHGGGVASCDVSYERRGGDRELSDVRRRRSKARGTEHEFYLTERFGCYILGHAKLILWVQSPSMTVRLEG